MMAYRWVDSKDLVMAGWRADASETPMGLKKAVYLDPLWDDS